MAEYHKIASELPRTGSEQGTLSQPVLLHITSGTKTGTSLNFHLQIEGTSYTYLVLQGCSTPERITLICEQGRTDFDEDKRCPHRVSLLILNEDLIDAQQKERLGKRKRDGTRGKPYKTWRYTLKKDLPASRLKENYCVELTPLALPHTCIPPPVLKPLQCTFKENSVKRSYAAKRQKFNEEKENIPQEWPDDYIWDVHGDPAKEKKLINARLNRRWRNVPTEVSENSKTIPIPNPDLTEYHPFNFVLDKFLQSEIKTSDGLPIKIWCLESEIHLLHDHANKNLGQRYESPVFIDGTFNFCSKLPNITQQYSFVRYYTSDDGKKGLSYPICFMWLPNKQQDTYRRAFAEIRRIFFEKCGYELEIKEWRVDFEPGPKKIIYEFWPHAVVKGCNFHFMKALLHNWKLKLGRNDLVFNKELRASFLDIYAGMPFVNEAVFEEALRVLAASIPSLPRNQRQRIQDFHNYFIDTWIKKRHIRADWNLHSLLRRGNTFWTTNQSESLHLSLKKSYRTPPATIRAASDLLKDYKRFFIGKFSKNCFAARKKESLERNENILKLHYDIERQSSTWRKENAISICSQFSNPSARLFDFDPPVYTIL